MTDTAGGSPWDRYRATPQPPVVGPGDELDAKLVHIDDPAAGAVEPWMRWGPGPRTDPHRIMHALSRIWADAYERGGKDKGLPASEIAIQAAVADRDSVRVESILQDLENAGAVERHHHGNAFRWTAKPQIARSLLAAKARLGPPR